MKRIKRSTRLLIATSLVLMVSPAIAKAQGCISFQPDFSTYTTESTDGTYVYTSVTFEGTGNMTITNPGSPSCPPGTPVHTAYVQNTIGSVGGRSPGESGCPDCYFSITNNQQIADPPPGTALEFSYSTTVVCSVAGPFWNWGGSNSYTPSSHTYPNSPLANCRVSTPFDAVINTATGAIHAAQDNGNTTRNLQVGAPVYAPEAGVVEIIVTGKPHINQPPNQCAGQHYPADYIELSDSSHPNYPSTKTRLVHVTALPTLRVGQSVAAGQQVGTVDISGCSSGPHVHMSRKQDGKIVNFSNPCQGNNFDDPSTWYDDSDGLDNQ